MPGPVLSRPSSTKPLIRLAFGTQALQSIVQCSDADVPPTPSVPSMLVRHRHAAVERPPAALCAVVAGYALSTSRLPRTREDCVVCEASATFGHVVAVDSCLDGRQADGDFGHLRVLIRRPAAGPILPPALSLVLTDRIEKNIVYLVYRRLSA